MPQRKGRWFLILGILVVFYVLFAGKDGLVKLFLIHREDMKNTKIVAQMHHTVDSLKNVIEKLKNDTTYIEKIAREELGMARKDEKVFKFTDK